MAWHDPTGFRCSKGLTRMAVWPHQNQKAGPMRKFISTFPLVSLVCVCLMCAVVCAACYSHGIALICLLTCHLTGSCPPCLSSVLSLVCERQQGVSCPRPIDTGALSTVVWQWDLAARSNSADFLLPVILFVSLLVDLLISVQSVISYVFFLPVLRRS